MVMWFILISGLFWIFLPATIWNSKKPNLNWFKIWSTLWDIRPIPMRLFFIKNKPLKRVCWPGNIVIIFMNRFGSVNWVEWTVFCRKVWRISRKGFWLKRESSQVPGKSMILLSRPEIISELLFTIKSSTCRTEFSIDFIFNQC